MESELQRILEPEVMDTSEEAAEYDSMDHREVNFRFVRDFLSYQPDVAAVLDLGTGTAQIPIELVKQCPPAQGIAVDLSQAMLDLAKENLQKAECSSAFQLELVDAKGLPHADQTFTSVMSNSILHHVPEPIVVLKEAVRVVEASGLIFFRDLVRPQNLEELDHLVSTYAGQENDRQRQLFRDSLHAALSLPEVQALVKSLGFPPESVKLSSDRHWTWAVNR
ncbi:Ubiquinone biosynthesis methyltransferase UbiE [Planctomycetales bacterium 10988]|nr:Ubiquinone biosynthesis methyltransferase UbiE [Planctomycetales bacterium 10988]